MRASRRRAALLLPFVLATAIVPGPADSSCRLDVEPVVLGNYDFLRHDALSGVGHVVVTCDKAASYRISLSAGAGTYTNRLLGSGDHRLSYNLYSDVNHIVVWGDGTGGSTTVSGSADGSGQGDDKPVYASVPAGQRPVVGSYSDAVVVTLEF